MADIAFLAICAALLIVFGVALTAKEGRAAQQSGVPWEEVPRDWEPEPDWLEEAPAQDSPR